MTARRALGLDLSLTRSGIALGSTELIERCSHAATTPEFGEPMARIHFIWSEIDVMLRRGVPDIVVIEDYAWSRTTNGPTLGELGGVVRYQLWLRGIPWLTAPSTTIKKFATGSGRASKDEMVAAALPYWSDISCHDEADAVHLARWGSAHYDSLVSETS